MILFGEQKISDSFTLEKACQQPEQTDFILKPLKSAGEDPIKEIRAATGAQSDITELSVLEKSGNRNVFIFSEKMYNQQLDSGTFEIKFPRNADINDLRGVHD